MASCKGCGKPIVIQKIGRPRKWCSSRCKGTSRWADPKKRAESIKQRDDWGRRNPEKVKSWARAGKLRRKYGLTQGALEALYAAQDGRCAACGRSIFLIGAEGNGRVEQAHVDHCHKTNVVRGVLCRGCNLALGNVEDDLTALEGLIRYLRGAQSQKKLRELV